MADITDTGEARSADRLGGWASQGWGGICRSRSWILGILALTVAFGLLINWLNLGAVNLFPR